MYWVWSSPGCSGIGAAAVRVEGGMEEIGIGGNDTGDARGEMDGDG